MDRSGNALKGRAGIGSRQQSANLVGKMNRRAPSEHGDDHIYQGAVGQTRRVKRDLTSGQMLVVRTGPRTWPGSPAAGVAAGQI